MNEHSQKIFKRWQTFSLVEQLGNIGSEVARVRHWQGKDERSFRHSIERALELFDFTLEDLRWRPTMGYSGPSSLSQGGRLYEIARAREVFCDAILGRREYKTSLGDLNRYFLFFSIAARKIISYE